MSSLVRRQSCLVWRGKVSPDLFLFKGPGEFAVAPQAGAEEEQDVDQGDQAEADEAQGGKGPLDRHVREHGDAGVGQARRDEEAGDQERGDGAGGDVGVTVGDVVEHGQPQERVTEAQDPSRHDRGPVGNAAVAGEGEPEQRDREEPDRHEGDEEAALGSVVTVSQPVPPEEVRLDRDETESDGDAWRMMVRRRRRKFQREDGHGGIKMRGKKGKGKKRLLLTDTKIQIRQIGSDITQTITEDKNVKYTVQVQKK